MNAKDKLETIFEMQGVLDRYIAENRNLNFTVDEWVQRRTMAMFSEVAELLAELNFKWWKNEKPLDIPAIKEELVDVLHFLVGACINVGMSADEMFQIYYDKNKENFDRQNGLSKKEGYNLK